MFMMVQLGFFSPFDLKSSNSITNKSPQLYCGLFDVDKWEDFTPVSSKAKE